MIFCVGLLAFNIEFALMIFLILTCELMSKDDVFSRITCVLS